jgi:hypothetical protein
MHCFQGWLDREDNYDRRTETGIDARAAIVEIAGRLDFWFDYLILGAGPMTGMRTVT